MRTGVSITLTEKSLPSKKPSPGPTGSVMFRLRNSSSIGSAATTQKEAPLTFTIEMKGGAPVTLLPKDLALSCVGTIALK